MSLVPSRHIHPASFRDPLHSSLCKFHGCTPSLQLLFRYNSNSSNSLRNHFLCRTHESVISELTNKQYPLSNSSLVLKSNKNIRWFSSGDTQTPKIQSNHSGDLWSGRWLEKWNEPKKQRCPKPPRAAANYQSSGGSILNLSNSGNAIDGDSGGGKGTTMERIVEKLKKFGYMDGGDEKESKKERVMEKGSVEDIFCVEEGILPNTRGGFSESSPLGVDKLFGNDEEVQFPWEKRSFKDEESKQSVKMRSKTSVAELTLPESELRRLRHLTLKTKKKMKIGGSGVTQAVVEAIHEGWKTSEVVRLKIEGAPALNMRRMHEILERKTGGLVIWRSGTSVSLYRGVSYEMPSLQLKKRIFKRNASLQDTASVATDESSKGPQKLSSASSVNASSDALTLERKDSTMVTEVNYEDEMDRLLGDLGPRYNDWPGGDPLPIDADMLPSVVPGFQPPFRLLPYGVRPGLGQKEATALRRLARTLPPHFALGRNRQLEGLATAIVKLWERSSIVKVALKRGVQLTSSERMAEDIKRLTGGVLLSRNKDFLVFYRGKNFLSSDVTEALLERERLAEALQDEEEHARFRAAAAVVPSAEGSVYCRSAGTLSETQDADARWGKRLDDHEVKKVLREAEHVRHADLVRKLERKLAIAERKLMKAERALQKVEAFLSPADQQADPESITYEERFMFRKLGLRMKAFLLLGRRGVFDGTVENMHLHWKYRELVKIIAKAKSFEEVKRIALSLEAESGGVLVSVDKVSKGYAIIVFRGKDYQRPPTLRPKNLLTKRRALARSIELQRHEALLKHLSTVQKNIDRLRSEIAQMENAQEHGDKELYDRLDSAYSSEEEESEDEGEDAYLRTLVNETDDGNDNYFQSSGMNRNFTCNSQDQNDEGKYEEEDSEARFVESEEHENEATAENEPYIPFQMVLGQDQRQRKVDKISEMAQEIPADSEASVQ